MIARKIPTYARALARLVAALENPAALAELALGRPALLRFRSGLRLRVAQPIDAFIAVETVLDDCYGLARLREPRCILDVGAGLGDFALEAARRFPAARVVAFEPDPASLQLLRENASHNAAPLLALHGVAIGTSSTAQLALTGRRVQRSTRPSAATSLAVEMRPLAAFVSERVDLLKIDCEGAERDVLASLDAAAWAQIDAIALEYHDAGDADAIEAELRARGFRCARRADRHRRDLGLIAASRLDS